MRGRLGVDGWVSKGRICIFVYVLFYFLFGGSPDCIAVSLGLYKGVLHFLEMFGKGIVYVLAISLAAYRPQMIQNLFKRPWELFGFLRGFLGNRGWLYKTQFR